MRLIVAAALVIGGAVAGVLVLDRFARDLLYSVPVLLGGFAALVVVAWALLTPRR